MSKRNDELYLNDMLDSINAIGSFIQNMTFESFI